MTAAKPHDSRRLGRSIVPCLALFALLAAILAPAASADPPATDTVLCKVLISGTSDCDGSSNYFAKGTSVNAHSDTLTLDLGLEGVGDTISCDATVTGKSSAQTGAPLPVEISAWSLIECEPGGAFQSCWVEETKGLPYQASVTALAAAGNGTFNVARPSWKFRCTSLTFPVECTYKIVPSELPGEMQGGKTPQILFKEVQLEESGSQCPGSNPRLLASTFGVTSISNAWVGTVGSRPLATTEAASKTSASGATLNGAVDPEGSETKYRFEYGTTTSYGTSIPVPDASAGSGVSSVSVNKAVTGLASNTEYHFRLVAVNAGEITAYGQDLTFKTPSGWNLLSSPNKSEAENVLNGVSCTSSSACTGVGSYVAEDGNAYPLAERWNGSSWSTQATQTSQPGVFNDVACASSTSCIAVGRTPDPETEGAPYRTFAESWNGTEWQTMSTPNQGTKENVLSSVSCTAATECTAVGHYVAESGKTYPLSERWNGTSWSIETTPTSHVGVLKGVSCTLSTSCVAVGSSLDPEKEAGSQRTFAMHWNGSKWTVVSSPNKSSTNNVLNSISCTSWAACTAVGYYTPLDTFPMVLRWDGSSWSTQSLPYQWGFLEDVSCASSTYCMAVGRMPEDPEDEGSANWGLGASWDGSKWQLSMPVNQGSQSILSGVSCPTTAWCNAAGRYSSSGVFKTLAERYQ